MSPETSAPAKTQRWLGPVAILGFLGLPLLLVVLIVGNLGDWWDAHADGADQRERIAQIEERIRRLAVEQARAARRPGADRAAIYLVATAPGLARAELQQRVVALVERTGGRLIEVRGEEEPDATVSILLRATLDITNHGLFDLLAAIETGAPLLTVESLNIRSPTERSGNESPDPALRVALAIRGHRKTAEP